MVEIVLNLNDKKQDYGQMLSVFKDLAQYILREEKIDYNCEVSLSLVNATQIRTINNDFRGVDKETDVLSFPMYEIDELRKLNFTKEKYAVPLGDVIIATDIAQIQADEFGHGYYREMCYLFVHSMYHLLGYDHMDEKEKKIMRQKEESTLNKFGINR